jgi:hypothetical protein
LFANYKLIEFAMVLAWPRSFIMIHAWLILESQSENITATGHWTLENEYIMSNRRLLGMDDGNSGTPIPSSTIQRIRRHHPQYR